MIGKLLLQTTKLLLFKLHNCCIFDASHMHVLHSLLIVAFITSLLHYNIELADGWDGR